MARSLFVVVIGASMLAPIGACLSSPNLTTANDPALANDDGGADGEPDETSADGAVPAEDAPIVDDAARAACAAACPGAGGVCSDATCVIACPGAPGCMTGITCPPGVACQVTCIGQRACGTVDCAAASSCSVTCDGDTACARVRSMATQTNLSCTGNSACRDVQCAGDACAVQCAGNACKVDDVKCCAKQCTVNGAPGKCK